MKIKLLQTKVYVNNTRRRRTLKWDLKSVRLAGQADWQKYIKNVDIGIHLFNGSARSPRQAQAQLWLRCGCVLSPLIRQITKVCASVGAVACGSLPRAAIISTPLDERPCPGPELLHLINSRLKCICSWAPDRGEGKPSRAKPKLNQTEPNSARVIKFMAIHLPEFLPARPLDSEKERGSESCALLIITRNDSGKCNC